MPIEPGATYVFDLGYYDYGWWARLDQAGCRIVTRLKANTPFEIVEHRPVAPGSSILSDRTGHLPKRLAASRKNPMSGLVREVQVVIETGKVLRIFTNDLTASAQEIADLYKRRWAIELFFRWVKQTLKINHFVGASENAVRIQIAVALIAFLLLRLAHEATKKLFKARSLSPGSSKQPSWIGDQSLNFSKYHHRRSPSHDKPCLSSGRAATRAAQRRRASRACAAIEKAA